MFEENQDKLSNKQKVILLTSIVVIIGASFAIIYNILEDTKYHNEELQLGLNEDGYFCRGIESREYYPLDDCKDIMERMDISDNNI